jgi:hypothetical protein
MKKLLLLFFLFFNYCFSFAQSKKANINDSIPFKFSFDNGWVLKLNALQPIAIGEFRVGVEKQILNKSSIELFGSYYIPSLQFYNSIGGKGDLNSGKYFGNNNYKFGAGYLKMVEYNSYLEVIGFYHYSMDTKDFTSKYFNLLQVPKSYTAIGKNRVFCFQILGVKRLEKNKMFVDVFLGFGLRYRYADIIESSTSNQITNIYSGNLPYLYERNGRLLAGKMMMYSLQGGVNIGFKLLK